MDFIDLNSQRMRIEKELNSAIKKVLSKGCYIFGSEVTEFERKIASYIGVKNAIACANGTDALMISLMAIGVGFGDAVFCPSFTFAATAEVVALVGAEPVFVDVYHDTYNINCEDLQKSIDMVRKEGRLNPKAIIAVDLFGLPADYSSIKKLSKKENLFLIEDAAQSIGGKQNNIKCGSFGDIATTSFYPAKPLGCYGDGGAIFTNSDHLTSILRSILFHGKGKNQYENVRIGMNSRLDTIQAAILLEKLKIFKEELFKRDCIANHYSKNLSHLVQVPIIPVQFYSSYSQYTIVTNNRDGLKKFLTKNNIPSFIYYTSPLHLQKAYEKYQRSPSGLEVSENLSCRVLSLPIHPYLSSDHQNKVIECIHNFHKNFSDLH